jgi:DNA mismatch repair protein MutS
MLQASRRPSGFEIVPKLTPVRKQYLEIKAQHSDAIVFFRLGDFYETFDHDAEVAARELDLVLTSRPVSKGQRVPMAGVPYHAVDGYIARLVNRGYRVAIADQVGDTSGRGLVAREVTRVVTPGTVVEAALLEEKRPNYLAAVVFQERRAGLAYADITTGEFATCQLEAAGVPGELARLQPRECLVLESGEAEGPPMGPDDNGVSSGIHLTPLADYRFELGAARQTLLDHFDVATLDGFGCDGKPLAVRAAGAVISYLRETQKGALAQIDGLRTYDTQGYMILDASTRRNLELTETIRDRSGGGSLLGVLDLTLTPMGGRLLRTRLTQPLLERAALEERLDRVEAFFSDTLLRGRVREMLKGIPDLERLTNRVVGGVGRPRDLGGIGAALEGVSSLVGLSDRLAPLLASGEGRQPDSQRHGVGSDVLLDPCQEVASLLASALADDPPADLSAGGAIRPGFSDELDAILAAAQQAKEWIASLEARERERTSIKSLKVGYNKVFGYYIEVTKPNLENVPEEYIRKQTLVNAERFFTPELKEAEAQVLNSEERQIEVERRIFEEVCQQVAAQASRLLDSARALARLDVASALAEVAVANRYVRPEITDEDVLEISAGRHPVVELSLDGDPFTPNDLRTDKEQRILVVTGPNMAGKSVYLRQNALIVLMAQMGSYVPADRAQIGVVDRIFTRIGAQDEVSAGQSTFMVEMVETARILNHATSRSLLILDEVGRGTSTYDGLSIAWAVVEYLHNNPELGSRTLFATHYHELTELAGLLPCVRNYNLAVVEEGDRVVFLHEVVPGGADRSYGIHVAQLAGVPKSVVHRAEELLAQLESGQWRPGTDSAAPQQPRLFAEEHPVVGLLRGIDVSEMTPLEAISKLYELQQRARRTGYSKKKANPDE